MKFHDTYLKGFTMNIIFGRDNAFAISEGHTVLELDTIQIFPGGPELTAFCVVETVPILDMPKLESMKKLHSNLLIEYRKKNWNFCNQALEHLVGFWNHELDSYYDNLQSRINQYTAQDPGPDWDGTVKKSVSN
jgi:hypothetical protein